MMNDAECEAIVDHFKQQAKQTNPYDETLLKLCKLTEEHNTLLSVFTTKFPLTIGSSFEFKTLYDEYNSRGKDVVLGLNDTNQRDKIVSGACIFEMQLKINRLTAEVNRIRIANNTAKRKITAIANATTRAVRGSKKRRGDSNDDNFVLEDEFRRVLGQQRQPNNINQAPINQQFIPPAPPINQQFIPPAPPIPPRPVHLPAVVQYDDEDADLADDEDNEEIYWSEEDEEDELRSV